MGCPARYAEAWEFAGYWCSSKMLYGVHQGSGNTQVLCDPNQNFRDHDVRVGMTVYNETTGASAVITEVDGDGQSLHGKLAGGTRQRWERGDIYKVVPLTIGETRQIEHWLTVTAAEITAAVQAQGGCDCITTEGLALLKALQIKNVSTWMQCGCMGVSFEENQRRQLRAEVERTLEQIRKGEIDLCGGMGSAMPAFGVAEIAHTDFAAARIVSNRILRDGV